MARSRPTRAETCAPRSPSLQIAEELQSGEEAIDFGGIELEAGEFAAGTGARFAESLRLLLDQIRSRR